MTRPHRARPSSSTRRSLAGAGDADAPCLFPSYRPGLSTTSRQTGLHPQPTSQGGGAARPRSSHRISRHGACREVGPTRRSRTVSSRRGRAGVPPSDRARHPSPLLKSGAISVSSNTDFQSQRMGATLSSSGRTRCDICSTASGGLERDKREIRRQKAAFARSLSHSHDLGSATLAFFGTA